MRWKRAMTSVCVYENTCPTCSDPLTVGGGVSIEYTSARGRDRSNSYTPSAAHRSIHLCSSPSRAGLSGTFKDNSQLPTPNSNSQLKLPNPNSQIRNSQLAVLGSPLGDGIRGL